MIDSSTIERCLIASARRRPESVVTDTRDLYRMITPGSSDPDRNVVLRFAHRAASIEPRALEVVAEFRAHRVPFRWWLVPSMPPELGAVLERLASNTRTTVAGLALATSSADSLALPPGVALEALEAGNLDDYVHADADAWGMTSSDQLRDLALDARQAIHPRTPGYESFLLRVDGQPAGVGGLRIVDDVAYLVGGAIRPAFRGRGLFRLLTQERLALARRARCDTAVVAALECTSAPIFRRLGFVDVCRCERFDWNA